MHPLVCRPPDFRNPATVRNHNELLRCFEVLARYNLETVLTFAINRFPIKEPNAIIGSLLILRHFVNSMGTVRCPD